MKVSPQARKKNPMLPTHWQVRAVTYEVAGKEKTVFTSLPVARFSTAQVATLYHERWEIELGYRDIKSAMQHRRHVHRKTPQAIETQGGEDIKDPFSGRSQCGSA